MCGTNLARSFPCRLSAFLSFSFRVSTFITRKIEHEFERQDYIRQIKYRRGRTFFCSTKYTAAACRNQPRYRHDSYLQETVGRTKLIRQNDPGYRCSYQYISKTISNRKRGFITCCIHSFIQIVFLDVYNSISAKKKIPQNIKNKMCEKNAGLYLQANHTRLKTHAPSSGKYFAGAPQ